MEAIVARAAVLEFELTLRAKVNELRKRLKTLSRNSIEGSEELRSCLKLRLEIAELAPFIGEEAESPAVFTDRERHELRGANAAEEQIDHDAPWSEAALVIAKRRRKLLKNKKLRDILDEGDPNLAQHRRRAAHDTQDDIVFITRMVEEREFDRPLMPTQPLDAH